MSGADLVDLLVRVGPVLVFLVAITVVAEIADAAGVFRVAAHWAARAGRRRTWRLWLLVVLLSCVCTMLLSLDTTAVLLTPVVIALAAQVEVSPIPFVMATAWLANTASLLLPVSNLTNLLALHRFSTMGVEYAGYLALAVRPGVAAIVATVVLLALLHRRQLRGSYGLAEPEPPEDRVLLLGAGAVCVALGPAFVSGITPAIPAIIAAVLLTALTWRRNRRALRGVTVPYLVVFGVLVLFVVVDFASRHGLTTLLTTLAGTGSGVSELVRLTGLATVSANVADNLPAYLALEPVAHEAPHRLMALLVGVNTGPLITPWASLATILWRQRCRSGGVEVSVWRFAAEGLLAAAVVTTAATLVLSLG